MTDVFSIISDSEDHTQAIAKEIAPIFRPGDVIILDGDLGAGKTCFVKGFTEGLRSKDVVTSPTFSIANFYRTNELSGILHIDLYRITTIDEFNDLGLVDYFEQSIVLIEWGKIFLEIFESCLLISFQIKNDHSRVLTFEYQGDNKSTLIEIKKLLKGDESC
jgi:tRNA threonylcarbamoyladenosine biosynthesis protein TsaE